MLIQMAIACARRCGAAFSLRKGTWLTQMKAPDVPATKAKISSNERSVTVHSPIWVTAITAADASRKGFRPTRSLMMPVGTANRPDASGARPAIWPMKSS